MLKESNVKVHDINYNRALVFLILVMEMSNMIKMGLGPYPPTRIDPEFTAKSLRAKKNRSLEGWSFQKEKCLREGNLRYLLKWSRYVQ